MLDQFEALFTRAKALRKELRSHAPRLVSKISLRNEAKAIGTLWHTDIFPKVQSVLPEEIAKRYGDNFTRLMRLSAPSNQVSSYLDALENIIKSFNVDLLIPMQQGLFVSTSVSEFDTFFAAISNSEEGDYLKEAIACAKQGFLRAAVVLGWSAAVDRIHRRVDAIGFKHFNIASAQMASQNSGRYKKFNQTQNVNSISEIRDVFDNVILWVIEGMALIDSNQHTRLRSCFDMRCQCAHPGDAPITTYNLLSFFSDLDQIIFQNPKFKIT